jgi:peroxiredoxin
VSRITRRVFPSALGGLLTLGKAAGEPRTPRPAGNLAITLPDGTRLSLSKYLGKVCVVEFLFTSCPHCQQTSMALSRLNSDLGSRGFQPLGVAFNEGAMMLVPQFVREFQINYPVGVAARDHVIQFLEYSAVARLMVPQVAIIDRKGIIRHQSSLSNNEHLHEEKTMRKLVEDLLNEKEPKKSAAGSK